jgi:hypothetical protein
MTDTLTCGSGADRYAAAPCRLPLNSNFQGRRCSCDSIYCIAVEAWGTAGCPLLPGAGLGTHHPMMQTQPIRLSEEGHCCLALT